MKIKYESVTGEITEVEVSEEIGAVIIDSRRKEENLARKERYHCYSIEAIKFGDCDEHAVATEETPLTELIRNEEKSAIYGAFSQLSEIHKKRILMRADGLTMREIANIEGISVRAVFDSLIHARNNFLKNFRNLTQQNATLFSVDTEGPKEIASSERRKKQ